MEENSPKIPLLEHVEQLVAIDPSRRDNQKPDPRRQKRNARKDNMEEILKDQQLHPARDDGHVDYHA
jgi:hypothetical protein